MTDLNHVVLTGNIVHDIGERDKVKVGETTKLTVTIANNQSVKVSGEWKNVAYFFDIEMWGKLADNLEKYLCKGKGLAVEGHLKVDRWEKTDRRRARPTLLLILSNCWGERQTTVKQVPMPRRQQTQNRTI